MFFTHMKRSYVVTVLVQRRPKLQRVCVCVCVCVTFTSCYSCTRGTGWRRPIGCLTLQVIFRKKANNYRALLPKMTCKNKASYGSSPPCTLLIYLCFVCVSMCVCIHIHIRLNRHVHIHLNHTFSPHIKGSYDIDVLARRWQTPPIYLSFCVCVYACMHTYMKHICIQKKIIHIRKHHYIYVPTYLRSCYPRCHQFCDQSRKFCPSCWRACPHPPRLPPPLPQAHSFWRGVLW